MGNNKILVIVKYLLFTILLYILYLHALNGRYRFEDGVVFDKWKSEFVHVKHFKFIE